MGKFEEDDTDEQATAALEHGLEKYPRYRALKPRIVRARLWQGSALMVRYEQDPPRDDKDAWEFQNAVIKRYHGVA